MHGPKKNVFNFGHKEAADQMRTSWEKLVQHVSTKYGKDIKTIWTKKLK